MQYRLFPDESINSVIQYCAAISMIKPMKSALCLFLLSMMPMLSWAVGDECVLESNPNLRPVSYTHLTLPTIYSV